MPDLHLYSSTLKKHNKESKRCCKVCPEEGNATLGGTLLSSGVTQCGGYMNTSSCYLRVGSNRVQVTHRCWLLTGCSRWYLHSAASPAQTPSSSHTMSSPGLPSKDGQEPIRYLSKQDAEELERELLEDYRFGKQQLLEILGHSCAVAVTKVYPLSRLPKKQPTVLVICGPEQNGALGLVCARNLRSYDYEPTIFYPKRSLDALFKDFTIQCEKMDIPFLSYLPTEVQLINDAYNFVVDAVLGIEAESVEVKEPYFSILGTMKQIKIPIISLDVPLGWDVEAADPDGITPNVLVSLAAPKKCALQFTGKHHFIAGRFLPYDVQKKFDLNQPQYPGTECVLEL